MGQTERRHARPAPARPMTRIGGISGETKKTSPKRGTLPRPGHDSPRTRPNATPGGAGPGPGAEGTGGCAGGCRIRVRRHATGGQRGNRDRSGTRRCGSGDAACNPFAIPKMGVSKAAGKIGDTWSIYGADGASGGGSSSCTSGADEYAGPLPRGDIARQESLYASTDDERLLVLHVQPCQYAKVGVSPVPHAPHCGDARVVVDVRIGPKQRDSGK